MMSIESYPVDLAVMALGGLSFAAGLVCIAIAVYLSARKREMKALGMPAWVPVLALGAVLTFIVPGLLVFLLSYVMITPTPPPPTCYAPKPPTCYDTAATAVAGLITGRGELLEKLYRNGKIPEHIYRKLNTKKYGRCSASAPTPSSKASSYSLSAF